VVSVGGKRWRKGEGKGVEVVDGGGMWGKVVHSGADAWLGSRKLG
jgi:hypothetical protein